MRNIFSVSIAIMQFLIFSVAVSGCGRSAERSEVNTSGAGYDLPKMMNKAAATIYKAKSVNDEAEEALMGVDAGTSGETNR